ncbi:MAG: hypothetical protein ACOCVG_02365 [Verrucomicrobiota bacterium]
MSKLAENSNPNAFAVIELKGTPYFVNVMRGEGSALDIYIPYKKQDVDSAGRRSEEIFLEEEIVSSIIQYIKSCGFESEHYSAPGLTLDGAIQRSFQEIYAPLNLKEGERGTFFIGLFAQGFQYDDKIRFKIEYASDG